jgi:DegV family protein with EDD domain
MNNYVIYTDSASDIGAAQLAEWGVKCASLTFKFDGDDTIYTGDDMDSAAFYERMRAGGVAKTAAVNMDSFTTLFEAELREGRDVLYIGFSSAMSTTFQAARLAASDLREQYPDRQIFVVDSLSGSVGQAMLVCLVAEQRRAGVTVAEIGVALWENDEDQKNQNYIHQLFRDLRQSLEAVGAEEIFERNNYFYSLNPEKLDCDYYAYLKSGKPEFLGEYMSQYSWAEETCGLLWKRRTE